MTYKELRAYFTQYLLTDPRIGENAIFWGESQRVLDALASDNIPTMFWTERVELVNEVNPEAGTSGFGWRCTVRTGQNALRNAIWQEEAASEASYDILVDFLAWLMHEHRAGRVILGKQTIIGRQDIVGTGDNIWGWMAAFIIHFDHRPNCLPAAERYNAKAYEPTWVEGMNQLAIEIAGTEFSAGWGDPAQPHVALESLVREIDAGGMAQASTDGQYLFLRANEIGEGLPSISGVADTHTFTHKFV